MYVRPIEDRVDSCMEEDAVKKAALSMGYSSLREKQKAAILGFIRGGDVFISLPTGSGKSLCYSILPFAFDTLKKKSGSIVLVISPLISLMKDQIRSLDSKGITATLVSKSTKISACKCCDLCAKECSCQLCGQSLSLVSINCIM